MTMAMTTVMAMDDHSALEAKELQGPCHGFQQILRRHTQHLSIGLLIFAALYMLFASVHSKLLYRAAKMSGPMLKCCTGQQK